MAGFTGRQRFTRRQSRLRWHEAVRGADARDIPKAVDFEVLNLKAFAGHCLKIRVFYHRRDRKGRRVLRIFSILAGFPDASALFAYSAVTALPSTLALKLKDMVISLEFSMDKKQRFVGYSFILR